VSKHELDSPLSVRPLLPDERFMRVALAEARKGLGRTSPNPPVGALVVRRGRVVSRGHHARAGEPHAEVVALARAGKRARGATLYTTLEPCDHQGRTPPCTRAILEGGIARVVIGSDDPNPLVSGRGARRLRRAGVTVVRGVAREACDHFNLPWFRFITTGRPFVTLKVAITIDGKLASGSGDSRWISGREARARVHRLRSQVDAVLVGAGTVRQDNPRLTARIRGARSPLRVVLDGRLSSAPRSQVFGSARPGSLVLTSREASPRVEAALARRGVSIVPLPVRRGLIAPATALRALAVRGVMSLMIEGGARVFSQFLEKGLWDQILVFVAPKALGSRAKPWVQLPRGARMAEALDLGSTTCELLGNDVLLTLTRSH
jgi:diaminohydroxyphosphoribosylaminopyrimidine deaminase/5-amino-6-(5-phosphoribosylamino)uracil reductase